MSNLSIATRPNLGADRLFQSFSSTAATAAKEALLSTLSNPQYDRLCDLTLVGSPDSDMLHKSRQTFFRYIPERPDQAKLDLAKDVFFTISLLTEGDFKAMDCGTVNQLYRKAMLLVHPDKNNCMDRERAHNAFLHLNCARETLGCR